jgi:hypothetical protein
MSLRVSKEHGLNPSVMVCFVCQKDTGVALLGTNQGRKAPHYMYDQNLCEECTGVIKGGGVILLEVRDGQRNARREPGEHPLRTGKYVAVTADAIRRFGIEPKPVMFIEEHELRDVMGDLYESTFKKAEEADGGKVAFKQRG